MATLSERFRGAVEELLGESTNSAVPVQEIIQEIILLSTPPGISGIATAPGTDDCTQSLLGALKWGLRQYGLELYRGYDFFAALTRLGRTLPHT